jgi:oxygen tolerance protein BatD
MRTQVSRRSGLSAALVLLSLLASAVVSAAALSVDSSIEPSQIALGESARLTIFTSGRGTLSLPLPVVPGLEFRVVGTSHRFQLINGMAIESTSTIVRVTPEEAGVFTIPGPTPNSPPLVLRVTAGGGSSSFGNGAAPGPAPLFPGADASGLHLTPDGSAFVHLEIPRHEIFVGESVPVEIQVGMRDGFVESLNGLPKLNSADFTLNNLSRQPERGPRVIDGKPFTIYTWHSLLAAVKPGTYSLAFEAPLTVRMRTRPLSESKLDDLLGDPFLQNIFGATVQKNIDVQSPAAAMSVLPLPAQGRPPNFGGAVGSFKISTDISSSKTTAGDPLTLRMHVSGAGNFDRVESSMLGGSPEWKTYDPKASFNATDPLGYRGEKIFEQPIIASQAGTHTVPPLSFNYFDPTTRRYETARSLPLEVAVAPAANADTNVAPAIVGTPADQSHGGLRPDHAVTDARMASLTPPYFQPAFAGCASGLALLFVGGWTLLRRRERRRNDLERERQRLRAQLTRALLDKMAAAAAGGDTAVFFSSARSALQQALSARWQMAPELITIADVEVRLEGGDRVDVRQIFALADEANYSGTDLEAADFEHWTEVVRRHLGLGEPS